MPGSALVKLVAETIEQNELFPRDARMVVGVSGGTDSMALLHSLLALNGEYGYQLDLHVAHLNHSLRPGDADDDAAFVEAAADSLNLPRTIETRAIGDMARQEKGSIEEIARRERYAFFERTCLACDAKYIAVGHHADDNVETILHRILRGTGLRGIGGIPPSRTIHPASEIRVVRPLLDVRREDLRRFLDDEGLAFREDATNAGQDTTRNAIRNLLLPQIETQINPQVGEALLRLAEQSRWAEQFIRQTVQGTFETLIISRTDQELVLNAAALARKSRIVQTELVRAAVITFDIGEQDLTFNHLKNITDLIADGVTGRKVTLPGGMTARLVYEKLILSLHTNEPREAIADRVSVHVPGKTMLPMRQVEIDCSVVRLTADEVKDHLHNRDRHEEWVDLENVHLPLVVRGRQPGDRFWPLGAPGSKKVADFLIDLKVEPQQRDNVAVLCDQLGPIWLIGYRIDERVKLTRITREALRLRARPLND